MPTKAIVVNVVMGCALIAIGLIPGLLDSVKEGIENFRGAFSHHLTRHWRQHNYDPLPSGEIWLAAAGAALILISVLAFFYR